MKVVCPSCGSDSVIRKGIRKRMRGERQIYQCKECGKRFTPGYGRWRYPYYIVLEGISLYSDGNSLEEAARVLRKRYGEKVSKSTVARWVRENREILSFLKIRERAVKEFGGGFLVEKQVVHRGLTYLFTYHRAKLKMLTGEFSGLRRYIEDFKDEPRFFEESGRCSQIRIEVDVKKDEKRNQACRMANLAVNGARNSRERHTSVERFMLVNDRATVAMEVPIYFYEKKLGTLSGHIDLLQVRFGKVYVMDYKPDASKEKPLSQLYLYAMGISFRCNVPFDKIRCAWFDESVYYEFSPAEAKVKFK